MSRRVLVTGGGRGIGRAICEAFRADGAEVIACGRSAPAEPLPDVRYAICDVGEAAQVRRLFAGLDRLDVLVNNAGIAGSNPLDSSGDDGSWLAILNTNLNGAYYCAKAALPLLPDGAGRIVNVASILGLRGAADQTAYTAAKHGVVGFTRALALHLAPRGVTVNALCPSWVDTEMAHERFAALGMTKTDADASTPTGRITTPQEVAAACLWLCSPGAANLTGQALALDGGDSA
jgi:NAD(P)-dependent dehydrogenase (short-subunit alcohol dehydrogenase family)